MVEADTVILRVDLNKSLTVESKVVGRKEEAICVAGKNILNPDLKVVDTTGNYSK